MEDSLRALVVGTSVENVRLHDTRWASSVSLFFATFYRDFAFRLLTISFKFPENIALDCFFTHVQDLSNLLPR